MKGLAAIAVMMCGAVFSALAHADPRAAARSQIAQIDLPADVTLVRTETGDDPTVLIKSETFSYTESYSSLTSYLKAQLAGMSSHTDASGRPMKPCPSIWGGSGPDIAPSSSLWMYSSGLQLVTISLQKDPQTLNVQLQLGGCD